jgi:hypothetical protein
MGHQLAKANQHTQADPFHEMNVGFSTKIRETAAALAIDRVFSGRGFILSRGPTRY